jgi:hypothetical protein
VLSRLFRRLFLTMLAASHAEGRLAFFGALETLAVPFEVVRRSRRVLHAGAPHSEFNALM